MDRGEKVLLIGGGGREHALAWKLAQSAHVSKIYVAPGNGGTSKVSNKVENVSVDPNSLDDIAAFCSADCVSLVVIGPEAHLAGGLVDRLKKEGVLCFGPSQAAARIESSKVFSKAFMRRHGIPTASSREFRSFQEASEYISSSDATRLVIKASGLASGKGVLLPSSQQEALDSLQRIMVAKEFGDAGNEVVIEERLEGEEASVLAFTDGFTVYLMPACQDHKRLLAGDQGPNTGGMGAYCPAPIVTPSLMQFIKDRILQPAVDGLRKEGTPFVGVLFAGLMISPRGVSVLEFNCRFGDPEAQALLPLLESDLFSIMKACASGCLDSVDVRFKSDAASVCVVAAAAGYPGVPDKGYVISLPTVEQLGGIDVGVVDSETDQKSSAPPSLPSSFVVLFHSGTHRASDHKLVTNGGRVLGVTGVSNSLQKAVSLAYQAMNHVQFSGMQYRSDIGHRALAQSSSVETKQLHSVTVSSQPKTLYQLSGVDIEEGTRAKNMLKKHVQMTYGPEVLSDVGSFGGLFDAQLLKEMKHPVLVGSVDGVGTKIKIAAQLRRYDTVGQCLVNHCTNDILVQGARPLWFLDYVAASKIVPEMVSNVVLGCAIACKQVGCALIGGETAEMPGVYCEGEFDVAGNIVGVVEKSDLIEGKTISVGDVIIGLESSGLHTNGYSLARRVFADWNYETPVAELGGRTLGDALLAIHRPYLHEFQHLIKNGIEVKGLAHITGGGLIDNPPRILPPQVAVNIRKGSWRLPALFQLIQSVGKVSESEMAHVFNVGLGMLVFVRKDQAFQALSLLRSFCSYAVNIVGEVVPLSSSPSQLPVMFSGSPRFGPIRIAVLGSSRGTSLQHVIDAINDGKLNAKIEVVGSNKADAFILERAKQHKIDSVAFVADPHSSREQFDNQISECFESRGVDLILLVGYMRILSKSFVDKWKNRIINVHPSLLPAFAGGMDLKVHESVLKAGVSETGCTVHLVDETVDGGKILVQSKCTVEANDTAESLKTKVQALEGFALVSAIQMFLDGLFN